MQNAGMYFAPCSFAVTCVIYSQSLTVSLFSVCCRQHSLPRDDGGCILLGRTGRQSGKETVPSDLHVCQRNLCLPFFVCPRLWLLSLLSLTFRIRVRFSPSYFIVKCLFFIIIRVVYSRGPHYQETSLNTSPSLSSCQLYGL